MFIRLTKTVKDKGTLIKPSDLDKLITDRTIDWYYSPFTYGQDALEYFEEHKHSIKGYNGEVSTDTLYWDFDDKTDFNKTLKGTTALLELFKSYGLQAGAEVYFSGNKGMHVLLRTKNKFTPAETSMICYNMAMKAGVPKEIFDTTVYNPNRIFRVKNTKHQASGLYKIQIPIDALTEISEDGLRDIAKEPNDEVYEVHAVDAEVLRTEFVKEEVKESAKVVQLVQPSTLYKDFNPMDCPPGKRRCLYVLESGHFGPGERENACIRLAAAYKGQGLDRETAVDLINQALEKREKIYDSLNKHKPEDLNRILDTVYSDSWNGGTYSCKADHYLASKCDLGTGPCANEVITKKITAVSITGLIEQYIQYGNEARKDYPKTGLQWIDERIRIRPRNFSVINGANGSGKTSFVIQILESLNNQKIYSLFFSLDMANTSLFEKLGAKYTNYTQFEIEAAFNINTRNPKIMEEVAAVIKEKLPYTYFDFTSSANPKHIESTITDLKEREISPVPVQMVFIDYAGRLTSDKDNDFANATAIALAANDIAKRTDTHCMYISQIPRDDGDHTKALYSSRVSKNSGAWEENATFCVNVWRPFGDGLKNIDHYMHLYIAKNRSGSLGEQVFWWEGKTGLIRPITYSEFKTYERRRAQENMTPPPQQFAEESAEAAQEAIERSGKFIKEGELNEDRALSSERPGNSKGRFKPSSGAN